MYDLFDDNRMQTYMNFGQTNAPIRDGMAVEMFGLRFEEDLNAPVFTKAIGGRANFAMGTPEQTEKYAFFSLKYSIITSSSKHKRRLEHEQLAAHIR
jgi:hypothetical protein